MTRMSARRLQTVASEAVKPVASTSAPPIKRRRAAPSAAGGPADHVLLESKPLEPIHNIHVATLHLRSYNDAVPRLQFFSTFALRAAKALGLPTSNMVMLPTKTTLFTVPKGPFVHKKSQENFWRKVHKRAIKVYDGNQDIVQAWFAYLREQEMGGVGMKAQLFHYKPLGWATNKSSSSKDGDSDEKKNKAASSDTTPVTAGSDRQKVQDMAKQLEQELRQGLESADSTKDVDPSKPASS